MSGAVRRKRPSPAVFRRRRLVVLLALAVVAAGVIWLLIAQPWSGSPAEASRPAGMATSPAPTPAATETPAPETTDAAAPPVEGEGEGEGEGDATPDATPAISPCTDADVSVEALTDSDTYRSGQNPQLSISLTNSGATDCTINVGTTSQVFVIESGNDTWWRSTDCQSEPSDMIVTLAAGQTVTSAAPLAWDRTRSSVSTCGSADRPRASAGGASYHLTVQIGGIESDSSKQFLLY